MFHSALGRLPDRQLAARSRDPSCGPYQRYPRRPAADTRCPCRCRPGARTSLPRHPPRPRRWSTGQPGRRSAVDRESRTGTATCGPSGRR
ncbi:hypothetical protein L083_5452 [Actinoplanes sp. N902-109]|nr:hypothetical protein L083_5452 [Actinoplanes sp. N902-109]